MALEPSDQFSEQEGIVELGAYLRAIRRHWTLAITGAALGGAISFAFANAKPVIYEGVTTVLVVPRALPSGIQVNPATLSSIVKNTTLASQIVEELELQGRITPQAFLESAVDVQNVSGTNIVSVKVSLSDPKLAAEASQRLAKKAIQRTEQLSQRVGGSIPDQLNTHLQEARVRLQKAEQDFLTYQKRFQIELKRQDTNAQLGGKDLADLSELYRRQTDLARLQANLNLTTSVYNDLALRYEQSRTQPLANVVPIQILDAGLPPDHPVSRKRTQYAAFGAVAGLAAMAMAAVFLERRRNRTSFSVAMR
jgi:uncharacterized protein involved in exopolysaccharide biosynthesis